MLHADQDGEKLQALLRLLTELMERVRVVDALSTVPQMYCLAVVEVVRRKLFIGHYREVSQSTGPTHDPFSKPKANPRLSSVPTCRPTVTQASTSSNNWMKNGVNCALLLSLFSVGLCSGEGWKTSL